MQTVFQQCPLHKYKLKDLQKCIDKYKLKDFTQVQYNEIYKNALTIKTAVIN